MHPQATEVTWPKAHRSLQPRRLCRTGKVLLPSTSTVREGVQGRGTHPAVVERRLDGRHTQRRRRRGVPRSASTTAAADAGGGVGALHVRTGSSRRGRPAACHRTLRCKLVAAAGGRCVQLGHGYVHRSPAATPRRVCCLTPLPVAARPHRPVRLAWNPAPLQCEVDKCKQQGMQSPSIRPHLTLTLTLTCTPAGCLHTGWHEESR
jgi:hypothetical protein